MNLYEALKQAQPHGDTLQLEAGRIVVTRRDMPVSGVIVSVPTLSVPEGKPRTVDVKRAWKAVKHHGPEMTATVKGARLTIRHPDTGQSTLQTTAQPVGIPTGPEGGWVDLTPETVSRVKQAAKQAAAEAPVGSGMNGVRVTSTFIAATDGVSAVVVWTATGLPDPVTLPPDGIRRLPEGQHCKFATTTAQAWFTVGDMTYWTGLLGGVWPETLVTTIIPARREASAVHVPLPDGWTRAIAGATLTPHDAENPTVVAIEGGELTLTIPGVFAHQWAVESSDVPAVGVNAHLLAEATKMPPDGEPAYVSIGGKADAIMLYTTGADAVETVVMPSYLPST